MRRTPIRAIGAAFAIGTAGLIALAPATAMQDEKPKKEKKGKAEAPAKMQLTPAVQKNLVVIQEALKTGDMATASAKINETQPLLQTADDKYLLARFRLQVAETQNDDAGRAVAMDALLDSGKLDAKDQAVILRNQGVIAFNKRDFPKAVGAFNRLAELQPTAENHVLVAQTNAAAGNTTAALAAVDKAFAAQTAAGKPVPEDWYKMGLKYAYDAKLKPETLKYAQAYVTAYPSKTGWRDALTIYRNDNPLDDEQGLDVWRLARAADALQGERDFFDYAQVANDRGLPGEADAVISYGFSTKMVAPTSKPLSQLKAVAAPKVAADKASLAASEKGALAAPTGQRAFSTANAYLSYGEYAKAEALYTAALSKGGVDADTANTRIGIAQAMQNKKAEALASFAKVNGVRKPIAQYWTIFVNQKA